MSSILPIIDAGLPTGIVEPFAARVGRDAETLIRDSLTELQINLGKLCNQTCTHCHVDAGPTKTAENMTPKTAKRIIELVDACESLTTIDLTGGAPELNPSFRSLVTHFRGSGLRVIDRCNLTILSEPGQEDLSEFLASHQVDIVASLPCYLEDNVDAQRGSGVFERSINGLQQLNALGYGQDNGPLKLNLVFNPTGPTLPPDQASLESDYKRELKKRYTVEFNHLPRDYQYSDQEIRTVPEEAWRFGRLHADVGISIQSTRSPSSHVQSDALNRLGRSIIRL